MENRSATGPAPAATSSSVLSILPGLIACAAIGGLAFVASRVQSAILVSPILLAMLFGAVVRNTFGRPDILKAGVSFAQKKLLRLAIMLLGLQITAGQLIEVGPITLLIVLATLVATYFFTVWMGRAIGVKPGLANLIAVGTSICGASAVVAANTVTRAPEEDVAYAVACVTIFGTISMVAMPLMGGPLGLVSTDFGLWTGASIHEIAQVVAAAFQKGEIAGHIATIAKLSRVVMLAPMVMALGFAARRRSHKTDLTWEAPPPPWFILGFLLAVGLNSVSKIPVEAMSWIVPGTVCLFATALAAMGLETDFRKLQAEGVKPLALGAAATVFIAAVSLALIKGAAAF